jgi:hypothetical protein
LLRVLENPGDLVEHIRKLVFHFLYMILIL